MNVLTYADDILLLSETEKGMKQLIETTRSFCEDNQLEINYNKTKIMIRNTNYENEHFEIKQHNETHEIEIVNEFKYLGMTISNDNKKYIEQLSKKGKSSAYMVAKNLKSFGNINCDIVKNTFEMMTLSKMKFCGEFCFHNNLTV